MSASRQLEDRSEQYRWAPGRTSMTDLQLVMRSRNGDEDATDELLRRARPVICYMAKRFYIQGQDSDDIMAIARMGVAKAIQGYDPTRCMSWRGYMVMSVKRMLITQIIRGPYERLRSILAVTEPLPEVDDKWAPGAGPRSDQPDVIVCDRLDGRAGHALRDLRARCSDLEYGAFIGLMRGLSYEQMSEQFGCSKKSVDNALSRFRRKAAAMGLLDYLTQIE